MRESALHPTIRCEQAVMVLLVSEVNGSKRFSSAFAYRTCGSLFSIPYCVGMQERINSDFSPEYSKSKIYKQRNLGRGGDIVIN
jgi:hypothetical protein